MGQYFTKHEDEVTELSLFSPDIGQNNLEEQIKRLKISYDILRYENDFLRRELHEKTKNIEELKDKIPSQIPTEVDYIEIENGMNEDIEALKQRCTYLTKILNQYKSNSNLLKNQLHYILRTKYLECENMRAQMHELKVKNELLTRELEKAHFQSLHEIGVQQRLIQVFSSCNSSKISASERIWDSDGCCYIPLKCKSPSNVTVKEIEITHAT